MVQGLHEIINGKYNTFNRLDFPNGWLSKTVLNMVIDYDGVTTFNEFNKLSKWPKSLLPYFPF